MIRSFESRETDEQLRERLRYVCGKNDREVETETGLGLDEIAERYNLRRLTISERAYYCC